MKALLARVTFLFLMFAVGVQAQTNQGSIAGTVFDPSGAVVAGAKVTAVSPDTGARYEVASSAAGYFVFPHMNTGAYDVTVGAAGFKTATYKGVVVQVGTISALDTKLEAGAVTQIVTVEADAPRLQTESSEIGTVVSPKELTNLPLPLGSVVQAMRSPEAFVFLTPGTIGPGTANGNGGTFESKINGGQNYATEILLDGVSMFRSENGSSFDETAPSVDALSEFKVTTSTMPPEMGRTTGGVESFNTKSGTNAFHGGAYELFQNEDMNANSFFNNWNALPRPLDRKNDYGLTFGGPVWIPKLYNGKDRTHFFFGWEQFRQTIGFVGNSTVPTAAERQGDFSDLLGAPITQTVNGVTTPVLNPCDGSQMFAGQIFDPTTTKTVTVNGQQEQCRTAFLGNKIPQSQWSQAGQNILAHYPAAPPSGPLTLNYVFPFSFPILDTTMTVRLDQDLSLKHKVYFTYSSRQNVRTSVFPTWADPSGSGRNQVFTTHYIRTGWDYVITPTLLSHFSLGYNRTNSVNVAKSVSGVNWDQQLGIQGIPQKGTYPVIGLFNGANAPTGQGDSVNGDTIDNGYRLNYDLTWVKGKHNIKAGLDYRLQIYDPINANNSTGSFFFWGQQTAGVSSGPGAATGSPTASLLLGLVHDSNLTAYASQPKDVSPYYGVFAQDSYKVTPTLVINYGFRWDVDIPRREVHGDVSNISLTTANPGAGGIPGALVFAGKGTGRNGNVNETWANTWFKDFGPRLGFAWSPSRFNGKTVLRGGFGIFYGPLIYADFGGFNRTGFQGNPGFSTLDNFSPAFSLNTGFPSFTPPPNLDPAQLNFTGPQYIDPTYGRPGMIENWSLEVQHELLTDLILDVAYVGQHSTHLRTNLNAVNTLTPNNLKLGNLLNAPISSAAAQAAGINPPYAGFPSGESVGQALRPFPQYFGFNTDGALEDLGQSRYDALQVSLRRRFRNGLNLMASYTWSKTLTDADAALPFFATLHGGGSAQNPFNLNGEKAISNQDVPHALVLSYVYDLPVGKGKRFVNKAGAVDRLVGGWQIGGIQRYQSGQPLSFCCASGGTGFGGYNFRYNLVKGQSIFSQQFLSGHFNPVTDPMFNSLAFSDPNNGGNPGSSGFQFGTMPRTIGNVRDPKFLTEDFNLAKRTHVTERVDILLRATAVDAFNRHVFNRSYDLNPAPSPVDNPNPQACQATKANPAPNVFGCLNTSSTILGPRVLQLDLRVEF
jgi:hypothetical protein